MNEILESRVLNPGARAPGPPPCPRRPPAPARSCWPTRISQRRAPTTSIWPKAVFPRPAALRSVERARARLLRAPRRPALGSDGGLATRRARRVDARSTPSACGCSMAQWRVLTGDRASTTSGNTGATHPPHPHGTDFKDDLAVVSNFLDRARHRLRPAARSAAQPLCQSERRGRITGCRTATPTSMRLRPLTDDALDADAAFPAALAQSRLVDAGFGQGPSRAEHHARSTPPAWAGWPISTGCRR